MAIEQDLKVQEIWARQDAESDQKKSEELNRMLDRLMELYLAQPLVTHDFSGPDLTDGYRGTDYGKSLPNFALLDLQIGFRSDPDALEIPLELQELAATYNSHDLDSPIVFGNVGNFQHC